MSPDPNRPGFLLNGRIDDDYLPPPPYAYPPSPRFHLRQMELVPPQQLRVAAPERDPMPAARQLVDTIDELLLTCRERVPFYRPARYLLATKLHYELLEFFANAFSIVQETDVNTLSSFVTPAQHELQIKPLTPFQEQYLANSKLSTLLVTPGGYNGNEAEPLQVLALDGRLWTYHPGQKMPQALNAEGLTKFYFPPTSQR